MNVFLRHHSGPCNSVNYLGHSTNVSWWWWWWWWWCTGVVRF